jgi:hypothetical protein
VTFISASTSASLKIRSSFSDRATSKFIDFGDIDKALEADGEKTAMRPRDISSATARNVYFVEEAFGWAKSAVLATNGVLSISSIYDRVNFWAANSE